MVVQLILPLPLTLLDYLHRVIFNDFQGICKLLVLVPSEALKFAALEFATDNNIQHHSLQNPTEKNILSTLLNVEYCSEQDAHPLVTIVPYTCIMHTALLPRLASIFDIVVVAGLADNPFVNTQLLKLTQLSNTLETRFFLAKNSLEEVLWQNLSVNWDTKAIFGATKSAHPMNQNQSPAN